MTQEETPAALQLAYLAKVLAGLSLLAALVLLAFLLPRDDVAPATRQVGTVLLVLAVLALVPAVHWAYRRCDEMLQLQHQRASMHGLAWGLAACALCGVLQAAGWLPLFNQFWMLGLLIAAWALHLVWADVQHKA
ncbi:MAG: hypothetical protein U5M53_13475 [Rhodoferax sp.]|nr:hypothetical protein [Rhodoferax sp.]